MVSTATLSCRSAGKYSAPEELSVYRLGAVFQRTVSSHLHVPLGHSASVITFIPARRHFLPPKGDVKGLSQ